MGHSATTASVFGVAADSGMYAVAATLAFMLVAYSAALALIAASHPRYLNMSRWRIACFLLAILALAGALLTPLHALAHRYLSAHMAQHLLIAFIAAPLLALSDAHLLMMRALPPARRKPIALVLSRIRVLTASRAPTGAWLVAAVFVATLSFWHSPAVFDLAHRIPWVHAAENLSLLTSGIFFWHSVIPHGRRSISVAQTLAMVTLVGLSTSLIGALIALSTHRIYLLDEDTPFSDQALAGIMMCIPASFLFLGTSIAALARIISRPATTLTGL